MDKDIKKSMRSLAGLLVVGGIVLTPISREYSQAINLERNVVVNYYDKNESGRIEKKEKREILNDLGYGNKINYKLKKEDFEVLYGRIK